MDCSCTQCVHACKKRPGWFLPQEIEPAAACLGLTPQAFFDNHLVVDYFVEEEEFVFVLGPAMGDAVPGEEAPFNPHGRCIFLSEDDLCSIHAAKPGECREYHHGLPSEHMNRYREKLVEEWRRPESQALIRELLGREPKVEPPSLLDIFGFMTSRILGVNDGLSNQGSSE